MPTTSIARPLAKPNAWPCSSNEGPTRGHAMTRGGRRSTSRRAWRATSPTSTRRTPTATRSTPAERSTPRRSSPCCSIVVPISNAADAEGITPLMLACRVNPQWSGDPSRVIRALLDGRCDDRGGRRPRPDGPVRGGLARMRPSASWPSIPGSMMSSNTKSTDSSAAMITASWPLSTFTDLWPCAASPSRGTARWPGRLRRSTRAYPSQV